MRSFLVLSFVVLIACQQKAQDRPFSWGVPQGQADKKLEEASGLVSSTANAGMFWTHNDSGHPAEVFLIDKTAQVKMTCTLKGANNRDWEDITIGAGPKKDKSYIYVGDIGDNEALYKTKTIYRFEEPVFNGNERKEITDFETFVIQLPDGPRDTEAMMIDPLSHDLFLLSKREDSVRLYQISYPFAKGILTAKRIATLNLTQIVAANISQDGLEVLMKNYNLVFYWKRKANESLAELLAQKPIKLPYDREAQGEAICFAADGSGYYTLSESNPNKASQLMFYKRK